MREGQGAGRPVRRLGEVVLARVEAGTVSEERARGMKTREGCG